MMQSQSISPLTLPLASDKIGPDAPRYAHLARRGFNKRFIGTPDCVRLVIDMSQGRIYARNLPDVGCVFTVDLPRFIVPALAIGQ